MSKDANSDVVPLGDGRPCVDDSGGFLGYDSLLMRLIEVYGPEGRSDLYDEK